tara:strand:- start:2871 stop:4010 length:1140 start_codon:yes stop_codon:yes gene_type:complete
MTHAMKPARTVGGYAPIAKLLTESRDIHSYPNLEKWSKSLCEKFDQCIKPYINESNFSENREIEVLINNYTYILLFKGELRKSRDILISVIKFWSKRYVDTQDVEYIKKALQPIINLARLSLIENKHQEFWTIIDNLSDVTRSGYIQLFDIIVERDDLSSHLDFISKVTFKERLKIYLKLNMFSDILNLEKYFPAEVTNSIYYREAQIIALINLEMYDDAISVIRGVMYKTSGITQNIFYYRLYEVYLCQGRNDESVSVIYNIYIEMLDFKSEGLRDLTFSQLIITNLDLDENDELSRRVASKLTQLGDEFNLTNMLLSFYHKRKSESVKRNISDIYSRTQYIQVSKKISSEFNFDLIEIPSNWNERLSNNLDFVLNSI